MSKEALKILGQICMEDKQYQDINNCVAFVSEALTNQLVDRNEQGENFIYVNPNAKVHGQQLPL